MTAYTPQVGDTVRHRDWCEAEAVKVLHVGKSRFFSIDAAGEECAYTIESSWVKVEPTPADLFLVLDAERCIVSNAYRNADEPLRLSGRLGCGRVARFTFAEWIDR